MRAARRRTAVAVAAGLLVVTGLTGCGGGGEGTGSGARPATTGPSELPEMQKLVDAAESAAAEAESAAADDGE